jgi:hypothetical protein
MTKLISGRYEKVPSANVSADRYEFLSIQEAEPDLGLPTALGQVFTSNLTGTRTWVNLSTSTIQEGSNLFYTDARVLANVSAMSINVLADVYITQPNLNDVLSWDGTKFIAQAASAAAVAGTANVAYFANVANSVISLEGHTTTEINEGSNLYYTNSRVVSAVTPLLTTANTVELTNLYFTNARVIGALTDASLLGNLTVRNLFANSVITIDLVANVITANSFISTGVGVPTLSSATNINLSANGANGGAVVIQSSALRLKTYTYAEANALTSSVGDVVYNSNSKSVLAYNGIVWEESGSKLELLKAGTILANSLIVNGNEIVTGTTGEANLVVTRITANVWNNLYTANVIETAGNLYFTNTRVVAALRAGNNIIIEANGRISANVATVTLNTSQVSEASSNLYFTNARVIAALSGLSNLTITGTFRSNAIITNSIIVNGNEIVTGASGEANLSVGKLTANIGIFNELSANNITATGNLILGSGVGGNILGLNRLVVSDIYSNVIYSNSIIVNGTEIVNGFSGGINLSVSRITANTIFANVGLFSSLTGNTIFANVGLFSSLTGNNISIPGNIVLGSGSGGNITGVASIETTTLYSNVIYTNFVRANIWSGIYTANVIETAGNLYFTNTRVVSALIAGDNVKIEPNGRISANVTLGSLGSISTDNVSEGVNNLYYTNSRAVSAVTPLLTTSNVSELTNLYFTNSRARAAITGGTGVIVDWNTGAVSIGQNVNTTSSVTFRNVSITNNLTVYGGIETFGANNLVVSDNMIYLNSGSINSNPDMGIAFNYNDGTYHHAGFFRDATDGVFKVFENYLPEPDANIFIDTDHATFRVANLQATTFIGNVSGTVSSLSNHNTDDLAEGTNKYYTDQRVVTAVSPLLTTANVTELTNLYYTNSRVVSAVTSLLTTANTVELNNLYFTNARVVAALVAGNNVTIEPNGRISANVTGSLGSVTTDNINEGVNNLYYTNTRVRTVFSAGDNVTIEANGRISANLTTTIANITTVLNNLTTDGVTEGSVNLYYTNSRVVSAVVPSLTTANVSELGNLYFTSARAVTAVTPLLTTANVSELGNLYFTGARAVSAVTPLLTAANIVNFVSTVNATVQPFLTTANVVEASSNLYFTSARAVTAVTPLLTTANVSELTNLYYTNSRVLIGVTTGTVQGNITVSDTIFANNFVTATGSGGTITGASLISTANLVTTEITASSWFNLYTANVIETASNLYFTGARAVSAVTPLLTAANIANFVSTVNATVQPFLTTANVIETAGNLYFTNTRVLVGITTDTIQGNITVSDTISANSLVIRGVNVTNNVTANTVSAAAFSGNSLVVDIITANTWNGLYTANVIETAGNLYFTNARVLSALTGNVTIGNLSTTGQIVSTAPGSSETGAGQIYLNGATNNRIDWAPVGTDSPTFTTRSTGTKVVLYPSLSGSTTDYAIGIDAATMWSSVPEYGDSFKFKWYGATTEIASLNGTGTFTVKTIQANIWNGLYTANVIETAGNLYFTNTRVVAALIPGAGIEIEANGRISANTAGVASVVLSGITTDNVTEGTTNKYFTNARVAAAISPGRGIAISAAGQISTVSYPYDFNTAIDGSLGYNVTANFAQAIKFNGAINDRFILRSIHITNISDSIAYVSSNVGYAATGNSVTLAKYIPVPVGGILEFLKKPHVFASNDIICLQSFNNSVLPASNLLSSIFTYETITSDATYMGTGSTIFGPDQDQTVLQTTQSSATVVSIKFVNSSSASVPVKAAWADANSIVKGYFGYNFIIPANSSVELLQNPKRLEQNDKIIVSYPGTASVSASDVSCFINYRYYAATAVNGFTPTLDAGGAAIAAFETSLVNGSTLYYSIQ